MNVKHIDIASSQSPGRISDGLDVERLERSIEELEIAVRTRFAESRMDHHDDWPHSKTITRNFCREVDPDALALDR